jgi:hypothetical protein
VPSQQQFQSFRFDTINPGPDFDVAVLVPPEALIFPNNTTPVVLSDTAMGADCYFVGYPFGTGYVMNWQGERPGKYSMPFLKRCALSGIVDTGKASLWILDGLNNQGFSGGPVVFRDPNATGAFNRVGAVVSGFRNETLEVKSPDASVKGTVEVNTGLIVAYAIEPVVRTIRQARLHGTR